MRPWSAPSRHLFVFRSRPLLDLLCAIKSSKRPMAATRSVPAPPTTNCATATSTCREMQPPPLQPPVWLLHPPSASTSRLAVAMRVVARRDSIDSLEAEYIPLDVPLKAPAPHVRLPMNGPRTGSSNRGPLHPAAPSPANMFIDDFSAMTAYDDDVEVIGEAPADLQVQLPHLKHGPSASAASHYGSGRAQDEKITPPHSPPKKPAPVVSKPNLAADPTKGTAHGTEPIKKKQLLPAQAFATAIAPILIVHGLVKKPRNHADTATEPSQPSDPATQPPVLHGTEQAGWAEAAKPT
jgi:hypothetical protein